MTEELQTIRLPMSSVAQNILGMFSEQNHIPLSQMVPRKRSKELGICSSERLWELTDEYYGSVSLFGPELTQRHKDILEILIVTFASKETKLKNGRLIIKISFDKLLRKLGVESNPKNYLMLFNALWDLKVTNISLERESKIKKKSKFSFNPTYLFSIFDSIGITDSYKDLLDEYEGRENEIPQHLFEQMNCSEFEVSFHHDFLRMVMDDTCLDYKSLLPDIIKIKHGMLKAIIRYCYGNKNLRKLSTNNIGVSFESLILACCQFVEPKVRTQRRMVVKTQNNAEFDRKSQQKISKIRTLFKENKDGASEVTKLMESFGIHMVWNNKRLFVRWDKDEFDRIVREKDNLETKVRRFPFCKNEKKSQERITFDVSKLPTIKKSNFVPITDPEDSVVFKRMEHLLFHADPFGD